MVNPFDYSSIIPKMIHKQDFWVNAYFDTADGTIELCDNVDENCNDLVKFKDDSIWKFIPDMKINFGTGPDRKNIRMRGDFSFQDAQSNDLSIHKRLICEFECCKVSYVAILKLNLVNFKTFLAERPCPEPDPIQHATFTWNPDLNEVK